MEPRSVFPDIAKFADYRKKSNESRDSYSFWICFR